MLTAECESGVMKVRSWVEFTKVDDRVTRFAAGLHTDSALYPEAAVEVNQARVAGLDLPDSVPEAVRQYFDAARSAYSYGAFAYALFAVAAAQGSFAEEFALGERYLTSLKGPVRVRNQLSGQERSFVPTRFRSIREVLDRDGSYPKRAGWELIDPRNPPMGLGALLEWARKSGILGVWLDRRWSIAAAPMYSMAMTNELPSFVPLEWKQWTQGTRDEWWIRHARRQWEDDQLGAIRYLRNAAAHPDFPVVMSPVTALHHLQAVFDLICALWAEPSTVP